MTQATITRATQRSTPLAVIGESVTPLRAPGGGAFAVFLQEGPKDIGPPPHHHDWDEAFYVVSGEVEFFINGEVQQAKPGDFINLPAGTMHGYKNLTAATMISMTSRSDPASFFQEVNDQITSMPPNIPQMLAIAANHDVTFAPPPAE